MSYEGDIRLGDTVDVKFTTRRFSSGAPFTLAGSPAVAAYVGNGTTEITAGITLSVDFDSRTGLNNVRVVATSGNGFATATDVQLVITAGTVDSVSVVGEVVASFSIEKRSAVMPTTAGRTLDVSAGGEAGVDWANVGSPTTSLALTGTTIATTQKVDVETIKTNPVVNAGTVTFPTGATLASTTNITAGTLTTVTTATNVTTVNGLAAGVITATSIAADAITDAKVAADVTIASVTGAVGSVTGAVGSVTGNVGGNVTGSVGSVASGGITATSIAADAIGASELAADAITEIAAGVWDLATSGHTTAGTFGAAMSAAGSAGDPWTTALPGAYGAGTAGKILGDVATGVKLGNVAHGGVAATITFERMIGVSATTDTPCVKLTGKGTGAAFQAVAETLSNGNAIRLNSSGSGSTLHVENSSGGGALFQGGTGVGLMATSTNGVGMRVSAGGVAGNSGMEILGAGGGGTGLMLEGGAGSGPDLELFSSLAPTLRDAILASALAEGYRAAGATASVRDMLYELIAHMGDSSIASTTKTLNKLNGTTAKTFTLDSAVTPTSITEAT